VDKPYLSDEVWLWPLYSIYSIILLSVSVAVLSKLFKVNYQTILFYSAFYFFFTFIPVIDFFTGIIPLFPDSIAYTSYIDGTVLYHSGLGYQASKIFYSIVGHLFVREPFLFLTFQIFCYFLSSSFIYKAWVNYKGYYRIQEHHFFLLLYFTYPSILLYIPTTLRESIFILSFSLLIYSLFPTNGSRNIFLFIVSFIILIFFRKTLAFMVGLYILGYKVLKRFGFWRQVTILLILFFIGTNLFTYVGIEASYFGGLRMWSINRYQDSGLTYGIVQWESYFDMLASLPVLSLQYFFSPLPIIAENDPMQFKALFLDIIFILFVLFLFLIGKGYKHRFWLFFIISLLIIPALYEFTFTGAVRHRIPAILLLILVASDSLQNLKSLLKIKKVKRTTWSTLKSHSEND
jgi:hypothetical protein